MRKKEKSMPGGPQTPDPGVNVVRPRLWENRKNLRRLLPPLLNNRNVRVTRSGYGFMGLLVALATAAFNTGNNLLYLILAMALAALPVSFLLSEYMIAGLTLRRVIPETVTAGEEFAVGYLVRNGNRLVPSAGVTVRDRLAGRRTDSFLLFLRAGRETETRARFLLDQRGRRRWEQLDLETASPFGWFRKTRRVSLPAELVVLPRPAARTEDIELLASIGAERPRNRRGPGEDLFGFRRYQNGDPVRDIHWKTTARTGELMVREREAEEERRLRLELRVSPQRPSRPDPGREAAVSRAAGIAAAALEQGYSVRVEQDGRGIDFVAGTGALSDILLFLALFDEPGEPAWPILPPDPTEPLAVS